MRIAAVLAMVTLFAACSPGQLAFVDLATLERPTSPNSYLVCPQTMTAATVDREPPVYALPLAELEQVWLAALAAEPRMREVASDPDRHRHLFVQRTPVLRFPDVVQVQFVAVPPDAATVCLYSRSVYGYSDLGQNRRRIEDWLARITPPAAPIAGGAAPR